MSLQHGAIARLVRPAPPVAPVRESTIGVGADSLEGDDYGGLWFPGECLPDTCSTYANEIDVMKQTAGISPPLFQNPIAVSTQAIQIARDNSSRREIDIVNVGTTVIYVGFGFAPTPTNYTFFLNACQSANDGTGGILVNNSFKGVVYVLASNVNGGVNMTEILVTDRNQQ